MNGFFNVLKPSGITSSDVVVIIRNFLRDKTGQKLKVGHLGTLDPLGAGVLPVAVGSARKLFNYLLAKTKLYRAKFIFGLTTDTLDSDGVVTDTIPCNITIDKVLAVLPSLIGSQEQLPPQYSSKCVNGVRAYKLARKGIEVELAPKLIIIHDIRVIESAVNEYVFDIECGSGTYIRSICRDMAEALGTCGYMASIIRLQNGSFMIESAKTLEEIAADPDSAFITVEQYGATLPAFDVSPEFKHKIDNGVILTPANMPEELFLLRMGGEAYGIAISDKGRLKMILRYDKELV
ncbi:MAG: tRNA pseudouridine(55) synthase TruB [Clostridia bacterium]|nr:tRNA pseudouridine(55) synthase TruB [Clostridia bacterium]